MQPRFAAFGVAPLGAARTIHPESDGLAFLQTASGVCDGLLRAADEDLAAFNRREGFDLDPSRSEAASHLSSRNPASDSLTRQLWSLIAGEVISNFSIRREPGISI